MNLDLNGINIFIKKPADITYIMKNEIEKQSEIWMFENDTKNPALCVLVNNKLCFATFFPNKDHPGFNSIGSIKDINANDETIFLLHGEKTYISNHNLIDKDSAETVMIDFFEKKKASLSIKWEEL